MDNSLLAVRDINHKYIVVEKKIKRDKGKVNEQKVYKMWGDTSG